jgi:hypothetical protein
MADEALGREWCVLQHLHAVVAILMYPWEADTWRYCSPFFFAGTMPQAH